MPRPIRIQYENAFYHVMNRGRGRQAIFRGDEHYQAFLQTLEEGVLTAALREPHPKKLITSQCEKYLEDIFRVAGKRRQRGKRFIAYCLPSFKVLCRPTVRHKPSHAIFKL